jgi:hypothetical protein
VLRQATAPAQAFSPTGTTRVVLRPPVDLNALEREEFAKLILGSPADFFISSDTPLIARLARNIVLTRVAFGEMRAAGYVSDGKASPWLQILQHAAKE